METLKDCKLDVECYLVENDADMPDKALCGMIESNAA